MNSINHNSICKSLKNGKLASPVFVFSMIFLLMASCKGQVNKEKPNNDGLLINDTLHKPQVNVKVNKQYDKNGNMIRYDSTYSYVYGGASGKGASLSNDSIFSDFKSYFHGLSPGLFEQQSNNIFFNDSLFKYDFFNDDYFQKRFELNQKLFADFYKHMDSLKGNYLRETYPDKKPGTNR